MPYELRRDGFLISTDRSLLDLDVIHGYLTRAYWCEGVPRDVVAHAIEHSLCFGAYLDGWQIGFARAVTDYATFAYLADVFVLEEYRGHGLSKLLMECLRTHPGMQGLRTWLLLTRDAHGLYRQYGFEVIPWPERVMVLRDTDVYKRGEVS